MSLLTDKRGFFIIFIILSFVFINYHISVKMPFFCSSVNMAAEDWNYPTRNFFCLFSVFGGYYLKYKLKSQQYWI